MKEGEYRVNVECAWKIVNDCWLAWTKNAPEPLNGFEVTSGICPPCQEELNKRIAEKGLSLEHGKREGEVPTG